MFLRHFGKSMRKIRKRASVNKKTKKESSFPRLMESTTSEKSAYNVLPNDTNNVSKNVTSTSSEIQTLYPAETLAESGELKTPPEIKMSATAPLTKTPPDTLAHLALLKRNEILLSNVPEDTTLVQSAMETIFETSNIEFQPHSGTAIIRFETDEDALLALDIARTFQLNEVDSRHIIWCNEMMTPILRVENISRDTMEEKIFSEFPDLKFVKLKHLSHKCVAVLEFESAYIAAKNYCIAKKAFGKDAEVYHVVHSDWRRSSLPLRDPPSMADSK